MSEAQQLSGPTIPAAAEPDRAPMLPIEGPIVTAALAVERARSQATTVLALLQVAPRDEPFVWQALDALNQAVTDAFTAYSNYSQIRSCSGQA
jgi:hypothetical protein